MIEQHFNYAKPFYEYFKIIKLDGLNYGESIKFLRVIGNKEENNKIEEIIKKSPQRIETLRQLTGGVPRTLVMLYDIFIKNNETAFEDLLKVLDDVTLLYKDRMDNLPSTLQDIVHNIAINWDGISTKELAVKTRLESKSVSSQLKQLEKYHIIEFESIGKNKIYKIKERFFNIWYLMRFGKKKDRNKVEWLVKFLTSWYDRDELNSKAKDFINSIKTKNLNENYIYYMCESFSHAGIDTYIEHTMKQTAKEDLSKQKSSFKNELSKSDVQILYEAFNLYKNDKTLEAIKLLENSKKSSGDIDFFLAHLYYKNKQYDKAEEYYLKAIKSGNNKVVNNIVLFYFEQNKKKNKAIELITQSYKNEQNFDNTITFAIIMLWNEEFEKSYAKFNEWLEYDNALESKTDISIYFTLLILKGQLYKTKEFLEIEKYQLKDRYKPIWYALMTLMQNDFPHEIKKMGSELTQSVSELLEVIEACKNKYSI